MQKDAKRELDQCWCWMVFGFSKLSPGAQRAVFRLLCGLGFKGLQWSCCRDRTFSVNEYWRTSQRSLQSRTSSAYFQWRNISGISQKCRLTHKCLHQKYAPENLPIYFSAAHLRVFVWPQTDSITCVAQSLTRTWCWDLLETCCSDCLRFFTFNVNVSKIDFNDI